MVLVVLSIASLFILVHVLLLARVLMKVHVQDNRVLLWSRGDAEKLDRNAIAVNSAAVKQSAHGFGAAVEDRGKMITIGGFLGPFPHVRREIFKRSNPSVGHRSGRHVEGGSDLEGLVKHRRLRTQP